MPSNYAHYRFGLQALPQLPRPVQRTIQRFQSLYEAGLHGPDLFFYYNPVFSTQVGNLGCVYHNYSGKEFFEDAAQRLPQEPLEAVQAYLYGVLGHYCLDSACHPAVRGWAAEKDVGHVEIETEFDRFLLEQDGKCPAYTYNSAAHLQLTWGQIQTIARVYPPATSGQIRRCLENMRLFSRLLALPEGFGRKIVKQTVGFAGEDGVGMFMGTVPNPRCDWVNEPLEGMYRQAVERFPAMAQALYGLFVQEIPLEETWEEPFG